MQEETTKAAAEAVHGTAKGCEHQEREVGYGPWRLEKRETRADWVDLELGGRWVDGTRWERLDAEGRLEAGDWKAAAAGKEDETAGNRCERPEEKKKWEQANDQEQLGAGVGKTAAR